jgi:hypothetical protein
LSCPIFVPRKHFSWGGGGTGQLLGCEEIKKTKAMKKKKLSHSHSSGVQLVATQLCSLGGGKSNGHLVYIYVCIIN